MARCIGIIVDGIGDLASMQKRFRPPGFHIMRTAGPRGHTVSIEALANAARKEVKMLEALGCEFVIVVLDFENRGVPINDFLERISKRFQDTWGKLVKPSVPNMMIENWYLADIAHISKTKAYLRTQNRQKHYEGKHGKRELRKCFNKKFSYSETRHGPELFAKIRFKNARALSASLDRFLASIESFSRRA